MGNSNKMDSTQGWAWDPENNIFMRKDMSGKWVEAEPSIWDVGNPNFQPNPSQYPLYAEAKAKSDSEDKQRKYYSDLDHLEKTINIYNQWESYDGTPEKVATFNKNNQLSEGMDGYLYIDNNKIKQYFAEDQPRSSSMFGSNTPIVQATNQGQEQKNQEMAQSLMKRIYSEVYQSDEQQRNVSSNTGQPDSYSKNIRSDLEALRQELQQSGRQEQEIQQQMQQQSMRQLEQLNDQAAIQNKTLSQNRWSQKVVPAGQQSTNPSRGYFPNPRQIPFPEEEVNNNNKNLAHSPINNILADNWRNNVGRENAKSLNDQKQPQIKGNPMWNMQFEPPAGSKKIAAMYGMTRNNGTKFHQGVDLAGKVGDPVIATHDGTILRIVNTQPNRILRRGKWIYPEDYPIENDRNDAGNRIYVGIKDRPNTEAAYFHLQAENPIAINPREGRLYRGGDVVNQGDTLGYVGVTGNSNPAVPHLHYGIRDKNNKQWQNPFDYINSDYNSIDTSIITPKKKR